MDDKVAMKEDGACMDGIGSRTPNPESVAQPKPHGVESTDDDVLTEEAIALLGSARPYDPRKNPTPSERFVRRIEINAFRIACASLLIVVALAVIVGAVSTRVPATVWLVAAVLLYFSALCGVVFLLADPAFLLFRVGRRMDSPSHHRLGSFRHERTLIRALADYPASVLAATDHWLSTRISRLEGRMAVVYGEKVSLFAILTFLSVTAKALFDSHVLGGSGGLDGPTVFAIGLAGMLSVAGITLRRMSTSYAFERQLLTEAVRLRSESDKPASAAASPAL